MSGLPSHVTEKAVVMRRLYRLLDDYARRRQLDATFDAGLYTPPPLRSPAHSHAVDSAALRRFYDLVATSVIEHPSVCFVQGRVMVVQHPCGRLSLFLGL